MLVWFHLGLSLRCRLDSLVRFVVVLKPQGPRFDPWLANDVYRTMLANNLVSWCEGPSLGPSCSYLVVMIFLRCLLCFMPTILHYLRQILIGDLLLTSSILNSASWLIVLGQMNFLWMMKGRLRWFSLAYTCDSGWNYCTVYLNVKFLGLLLDSQLAFMASWGNNNNIGVICIKLSKITDIFLKVERSFEEAFIKFMLYICLPLSAVR